MEPIHAKQLYFVSVKELKLLIGGERMTGQRLGVNECVRSKVVALAKTSKTLVF